MSLGFIEHPYLLIQCFSVNVYLRQKIYFCPHSSMKHFLTNDLQENSWVTIQTQLLECQSNFYTNWEVCQMSQRVCAPWRLLPGRDVCSTVSSQCEQFCVIVCLSWMCVHRGFPIYPLFLHRFCDSIEECHGEAKGLREVVKTDVTNIHKTVWILWITILKPP